MDYALEVSLRASWTLVPTLPPRDYNSQFIPSFRLARGIAKASSAGFISSIATHARELTEMKGRSDSKEDTPTISVEYGNR